MASTPEEEEFFEALRATGRLEPPGDSDGFMLVTQNKGNNKIDSYLNRSVDYLATYDPSNGQLESTATITLRNDAPASGLPLAIIGSNDQGLAARHQLDVLLVLHAPPVARRDAGR